MIHEHDDELTPEDEPTERLMREAFEETRELVRLEVALALQEARTDFARAKNSAALLGAAAGVAVAAITMFLVSIALASSTMWLTALGIAFLLSGGVGVLGYVGYNALPTQPMARTKQRIESEVAEFKERIA
ncbi:MAG: phage holin family protein [Myxococcota bacterium]|nr:phage holin family protein [Myxococcota bacterium]